MTPWTINGRGDTGTRAIHREQRRGQLVFNVCRLAGGFWLSEVTFPDRSTRQIDATARSEALAHMRCEYFALVGPGTCPWR